MPRRSESGLTRVAVVLAGAACVVWAVAAFAYAALGEIEEPATRGEVVSGAAAALLGIVAVAGAAVYARRRKMAVSGALLLIAGALFLLWLEVGVEPTRAPA